MKAREAMITVLGCLAFLLGLYFVLGGLSFFVWLTGKGG